MVIHIKPTPRLKGKDADRFIKEWMKECKHPSKKRIEFIKNAEKKSKFFERLLSK